MLIKLKTNPVNEQLGDQSKFHIQPRATTESSRIKKKC